MGLAACVCVAALSWAGPASAASGKVVRCESEELRRVHCPMDTGNGVDLVRQLSGSACIREVDWGLDTHGVWVARGCRAEFRARDAGATVARRVIRCESSSGRTRSCAVSLRGAPVRLLRQSSVLPCRRDESWGVGRNEVWVSRGCKGEFEIGDRDGGFPPGQRLLTCESKDRVRRDCGTTVEHGVVLLHQLSGMPCEEGVSWGWGAERVWVDKGCRAQFGVE
ncbi:DUF3011 domain-containing protein [Pseudoxanthomonas suwonensis]|uniref:DUF3011 domain-containing protein n=1 Tax=Pseudoxanthomonas suwonensis TaxID=314722 RepID=A0A0E3Z2N3_9GAMM|nr:DUF3011 domain-containing protein [Pseudoxanthomonas suwonensis]AKC87832.1 hypothetical protein WQ53_14750 [Pseudoxanthomonas suwonensis]